jgi:hypothetical protein
VGGFQYFKKFEKGKKTHGKATSPLEKKVEKSKWGDFHIEELFKDSRGDTDIQKKDINGKGEYVITSGLTQNGVMGKTNIPSKTFDKKTLTIDMFGNVFYRPFQYKMVTHARVFSLKPKFKITEKQGLFISSTLHFLDKLFSYNDMCTWKKIKKLKIKLPQKNGNIDLSLMEEIIKELEAERIKELEAYLVSAGLDNYTLTDEESKLLKKLQKNEIKFKKYIIEDFFGIESPKKVFHANKVSFSDFGKPYVVRSNLNNGIKGYINENPKFLNEGNTFSFGQDTGTIFYQEKPYFNGNRIKILKPKNIKIQKENALVFLTTMKKTFDSFGWGVSDFSSQNIKKQSIHLPTKNNEYDYDTAKTLIRAISKEIIKDVVSYSKRKVDASKFIIERETR